ncbi:MAG TPA: hypothetical protein PLL32_00840 [Anaeromyxobacteraceae bacterium]|nr:hypothetical protein [Anaeromyxobacteraceae bacterium]
MLLHVAAILAVAVGQVDGATDRPKEPPGNGPVDEASPPGIDAPTSPAARADDDITGPPGVPYMPSVGSGRLQQGFLLDGAVLTAVRTRTLTVTSAAAEWGTDLEITPGLAVDAWFPNFFLTAGYAPRITIPFGTGTTETAILNRATFRASWKFDPLWTLTPEGVFVFGDYSQLMPASTPGGAGPPPTQLDPVRSFQTYPYVGIDTRVRLDGQFSPRTRIAVWGGYFDTGGVGAAGEAAQPRAWGPQGDVTFAWDASRAATLATSVAAQGWLMQGSEYFFLTTVTEAWTHSWSTDVQTTLAAGGGYANRDVESQTAARHLVPVVSAAFRYHPGSTAPLRLTLDAALGPYYDTYARIPYQRITAGASVDWRPSDQWALAASLAFALAPYTVRVPESYGTGGASASFAPLPFLVLTAGAFTQSQFQGQATPTGAFRQWTIYLSLALRERLSL